MKLRKIGRIYHAELDTQSGKRATVTTRCTDKKDAQKLIKESGLDKLELAAKTHRLTSEGVARILAGKRITIERAIPVWAEWLRTIGGSPRTSSDASGCMKRRGR